MVNFTVYSPTAVTLQEALVKEDVSDLISNLFPLDTPLQQVLTRRPMNNVFSEQPIDTFNNITRTTAPFAASASFATTFAKPEAFAFATGTPQYPARLKSVAEIQGIAFGVSDTDRAMSMYGIGDRFSYEALKTTQAVVNNFEHSFWWSPGTPPGGADLNTTGGDPQQFARQTQGLCYWIFKTGLERSRIGATPGATSNQASYTDGHGNDFGTTPAVLGLGAGSWAYNANGLVLDQTMFKEQLMSRWWQLTGRTGGAVGFAGPKIKNLFSQFALTANGPINERTLEAAAKKVVDTVDYYETDFGVVSINLCRYLSLASFAPTVTLGDSSTPAITSDETLIFIHPRYFQIGVVRGVSFASYGKTGDFESGLIRGEQALYSTNPGGGTGLTNAIP